MSKEMRQHIDNFNKFRLSENLNISDVRSSKILERIEEMEYKGTFYAFENREDLQEGRTDWETLKDYYLELCYLVKDVKSILKPDIDSDEDE
jgi:hypothetical protein